MKKDERSDSKMSEAKMDGSQYYVIAYELRCRGQDVWFTDKGGYIFLTQMDNSPTCVTAYEMRRRGYDVQAVPRDLSNELQNEITQFGSHSQWEALSKEDDFIISQINSGKTQGEAIQKQYEFIDKTVGPNRRYAYRFLFEDQNKHMNSHVLVIEKDNSGKLVFIDPEMGQIMKDKEQIWPLLDLAIYPESKELSPYLYPIDNKILKPKYSEALLQARKQ